MSLVRRGPAPPRRSFWVAGAFLALLMPGVLHAQSSWALEFDGVDDYVEVGDPLDFNGPFTVEAWIYARSGVDGGRFVSTRTGASGWEMDVSEFKGATDLRLSFNGVVVGLADFTPYLSTWTHVAGTWEGPGLTATARLYINATEVDSRSYPESIVASGTNLLFGWDGGGQGYYDGLLDEVRIFDTVVDQPTLAAWMHAHATSDHPDFASLVGDWRMDEGAGQTASSELGSPTLDGRLGDTAGPEASDPTWTASDVVPVREVSVGEVKERYRPR